MVFQMATRWIRVSLALTSQSQSNPAERCVRCAGACTKSPRRGSSPTTSRCSSSTNYRMGPQLSSAPPSAGTSTSGCTRGLSGKKHVGGRLVNSTANSQLAFVAIALGTSRCSRAFVSKLFMKNMIERNSVSTGLEF